MGVIYKLRPEVKEYILEEKKNKPILSCRGLVALVDSRFKFKVSKSTINALFKEAGLSMPVGRTRKKRRRRPQIPTLAETPLLETEIKQLIEAPAETDVEKAAEEISVDKIAEEPVKPLAETAMEKPVEVQVEVEELPLEMPCTGAIILKVADYLIGGSAQITEVIKNRFKLQDKYLLAKTEGLIYRSLWDISKEEGLHALWAQVNKKIPSEALMRYLTDLQQVEQLPLDLSGAFANLFQEVRCIKLNLSDGVSLYLDGQLHTIWSTPHIPDDFSTTIYNIKSYINKYFYSETPFIFFMAPGYDTPTKEFFDFILSLEAIEKKITNLSLYDRKFNPIEVISFDRVKKHPFILGLWPWQFGQFRKAKLIGEFKSYFMECLKKDVYLANIEIELWQPNINKRVTLKGAALRTNLKEKTRLVILSNLSFTEINPENLVNLYLSHWPNLEEGFQDFSRKIELFTYTASAAPSFSQQNLDLEKGPPQDITHFFNYYLKVLDLYVRYYLLPSGYKNQDFSTVNERFYSLKAQLKQEKNYTLLTFHPPQAYPFLKDLEYACHRINEREILLADGRRPWCS